LTSRGSSRRINRKFRRNRAKSISTHAGRSGKIFESKSIALAERVKPRNAQRRKAEKNIFLLGRPVRLASVEHPTGGWMDYWIIGLVDYWIGGLLDWWIDGFSHPQIH
jgi:hypothetical protein